MNLFLLAACTAVDGSPEPGGPIGPVIVAEGIQIGEEGDGISCDELELPVADPSVPTGNLEFSADDFLEALPDPISATLQTADGASVALEVELTVDGDVRYVTWVPQQPGIVCDQTWYRVDATVDLSAPPLLDERVRLWAEARTVDAPSWTGALRLDDVRGTLRPVTLDPDAWDEVFLDVPARRDDGSWTGNGTWWARRGEEWDDEPAFGW